MFTVLYNTAGITHKQCDLRAFMNHFIQMFGSIKYCDVFLKPFSIRTLWMENQLFFQNKLLAVFELPAYIDHYDNNGF